MNKDVAFFGLLAIIVTLLFVFASTIEIPFYPQDVQVQKLTFVILAGSVILFVAGIFYPSKPEIREKDKAAPRAQGIKSGT